MNQLEDSTKIFRPSRTELAWPGSDWDNTWRLARSKGLGPEVTTFLWRLLHNLLPTQERLNHMMRNTQPLCKLCQDQLVEDQPHAFFLCGANNQANQSLLSSLSPTIPNITIRQILLLDFQLDEPDEFPVVWLVGNFLLTMWNLRVAKKQARLFSIKADLEARASLLRETRYGTHLDKIKVLLQLGFSE